MKRILIIVALLLSAGAFAAVPKPPSLCLDDDCPAETPSTGKGVKWNPGHYMLVHIGDSHELVMNKHIPEVCREGGLQGLQYRIDWHDLEAAKGQYTFGRLDEVYDALAACRKRLVVHLRAGVFNTSDRSGIAPDYILRDPEYNGGITPTVTGHIIKLWEAPIMDRYIALFRAMAARYDSKPYFETIMFPETATSQAGDSYDTGAWLTQLKRFLAAVPPAWPNTNVVMFSNFIQGSSQAQRIDILNTIRASRTGTGGPDVLPPPHAPEGEKIYRGQIGGTDMRGLMPAMFAVQTPELGGKEGTFTPRELYNHCVSTNRCSHMFWIRNTTIGGDAQQWDTGILPFLRTLPRTVTACPRNYSGCVTGGQ